MNAQTVIPVSNSRWSDAGMYCAIAVWATAVGAGWVQLQRFDFSVHAPLSNGYVRQWPEPCRVQRAGDRPTLVLFMHPKCPCTRATVGELERLFTSVSKSMPVKPDFVVFNTMPAGADESWLETETVYRVSQLPNVQVVADRGGEQAALFGATTSGLVMYFDADGRRRYAGGVTAARGHEGDNVGRSAVAQLLRGDWTATQEMPSFGCRLCLPEQGRSTSSLESQHATSHVPVDPARRTNADVPQPPR